MASHGSFCKNLVDYFRQAALESLVDKISDYGSINFLSLTLPIKQLQLTVT
ncbi:hypothetical protein WH8501_10450 [Crocosphaera watsonii WH 8501]|uniref:hypothetical protein n=1 Tax=Crocosphaera watsonii TaxID=263511 RepID=UPI001E2EB096|nr:hypothetical protein [Crocosphaera watsonii]